MNILHELLTHDETLNDKVVTYGKTLKTNGC